MLNPEEYRRKADECVRLAAQASDSKVRSDYEEVARSYRQLAAEVEIWKKQKGMKAAADGRGVSSYRPVPWIVK
jgi:hypothetical protein